MERVEQRLDITPPEQEETIELVNVQERNQILEFAEQLAQPEITFSERLNIAEQLRVLFGNIHEHAPPREGVSEKESTILIIVF